MDFAPGIGDAKSAADALKEAEAGNYGMSLLDAFGALPMVGGMGAIKAFHGSPHKFDAFDMSKIGTGEGAQAYGHGLYFAENPETAASYQNAGGKISDSFFSGGKELKGMARNIADDIVNHGLAVAERNAVANGPDFVDVFERLKRDGVTGNKANLYETSLEWPDPAREASDPLGPQHFLDWDKPLSEQPKPVRDALRNAGYSGNKWLIGVSGDGTQGVLNERYVYDNAKNARKDVNELRSQGYSAQPWLDEDKISAIDLARSRYGDDYESSQILKELGIPGIRYLDQGSRGAGDGTYNFVVFDQDIPKIVSRNGVSLRELYGR
jgi:hypothetical protein